MKESQIVKLTLILIKGNDFIDTSCINQMKEKHILGVRIN